MLEILIRYLGIKTKLLDEIKQEILSETEKGDVILDLFAGSNIVAQSLMQDRIVYTNDIQKYSFDVAKLMINGLSENERKKLSINNVIKSEYYNKNVSLLRDTLKKPLEYEKTIVSAVAEIEIDEKALHMPELQAFKEIYDNEPYMGHPETSVEAFWGMEDFYSCKRYSEIREQDVKEYYNLFCLLYAMPYFSLNQAVIIDSYRYAIDKMLENKEITQLIHNAYLCALIFLLQNIVCSVGDHFAQPQQLKLINERKHYKEISKIIGKKNFDVIGCLEQKINEIKEYSYCNFSNKCFNRDYLDLLTDDGVMNNVSAIYIDPPYTNAHYSRFYHILETLVNYDYPEIEYKGRYRTERIQSPFCVKSKVEDAFRKLILNCACKNKKLFISYADTQQCMITKDKIIEICGEFYTMVEVKEIEHMYRNFGQKAHKVVGKELIISCR